MLRRIRSTSTKKKGNATEKKVPFEKAIASFGKYQSGYDLCQGYRLGPHIAAGADGDVFRGLAKESGMEVAIKRVRLSSAIIQRHAHQEIIAVFHSRKMYAEEVGNPRATGHPCIVGYLDWFAGPAGLDREVCIVMELCNFGIGELVHTGKVMRSEYEKLWKAQQPLQPQKKSSEEKPKQPATINQSLYRFPEREILKVMFQMLSALSFLNRHGILHRDIKTENILWNHGIPEGSYKLADFGVAFCEVDDSSQRTDDCGTLWTMAPELLGRRCPPGPSCDVWSLGVVLYEMAFFDKPFTSLELLGFRNGGSLANESFWESLLGGVKGNSCPAGTALVRSTSNGSGASPRSPLSGGGRAARMAKQASVPTLPAVAAGKTQGPTSPKGSVGSTSPKADPIDRLASPKLGNSRSTSRSALSRSRTMGSMELARAAGEDEPCSPTSPQETMRGKKRAFLRKKGSLRWIYSEELRTTLIEEMLEEEGSVRNTPAEILASPRLQNFLSAHDHSGWQLDERCLSSSSSSATTGQPSTPSRASPRAGMALPSVAKAAPVMSEAITWSDAPPADVEPESPLTKSASASTTSLPAVPVVAAAPPRSPSAAVLTPTASGSRPASAIASAKPNAEESHGAAAASASHVVPATSSPPLSHRSSTGKSRPSSGRARTPRKEPALPGMNLKQLTPEAFLEVLTAQRNMEAAVLQCADNAAGAGVLLS
mmetsp:Transcript_142091/g.250575  ORF Transcript_142091/g.250575 Transcript_142091/m.250575 type:complete len:712 (+) Transcript_142091:148-2283(+)